MDNSSKTQPPDQPTSEHHVDRDEMSESDKLKALNRPSWFKPIKGPLYFAAILIVVVAVYMTFFRPTGASVTGDLPAAMNEAQQRKLPMLITFTDPPTCPPCAQMEKQSWPDQRVLDYVKDNYVVVKLNPYDEKNEEFVARYKINSIPTMIIATSDGSPINSKNGFMKPEVLINFMEQHREHAIAADPNLINVGNQN